MKMNKLVTALLAVLPLAAARSPFSTRDLKARLGEGPPKVRTRPYDVLVPYYEEKTRPCPILKPAQPDLDQVSAISSSRRLGVRSSKAVDRSHPWPGHFSRLSTPNDLPLLS